ncbi:hypothetical protein [Bordetella muralis]|jgi:hypothetical protein|uniref:hypothetical protein n=1 Tax=Bordetella muralis TaxID=1649130 RepID=UPI0039EEBFD5
MRSLVEQTYGVLVDVVTLIPQMLELIASCQQPGKSLTAIAMDHGINPNLLRRWMLEHERLGHHEPTQGIHTLADHTDGSMRSLVT